MKNSFNIVFSGDFAPINVEPSEKVFENLNKMTKESDFAFLNLEAPLTNSSERLTKDGSNLKCKPSWIKVVKNNGYNILGLANNHILDMKEKGLFDSIDNIKQEKLEYCGAGKNIEEASKILYINKNNVKLSIIATCENEFSIASKSKPGAFGLDTIMLYNKIQDAKKNSDKVIVTIHGGNEHFEFPRPKLRELCKFVIDVGANSVVCHHSHIIGTIEEYKGGTIFYSLGNLFFPFNSKHTSWYYGCSVQFQITKDEKLDYELIYHRFDDKSVYPLEGDELLKIKNSHSQNNDILQSPNKYMKKWNNYCKNSEFRILANLFLPYKPKRGLGILKRLKVINIFLRKKELVNRLNILRCESHKEILENILEKKYEEIK